MLFAFLYKGGCLLYEGVLYFFSSKITAKIGSN